MKFQNMTRRRFLWGAAVLFPIAVLADARMIEPRWFKVKRVNLADGKPKHRLVHFSDLHHKGNTRL